MEKKIEPMELMLETLNLGSDEIPFIIKIVQEKKDLKELLIEFHEVFAWSYEDMLGIDPEIASHRIDIRSHIVLVKQKLRRMRTKWPLKIKEEVNSN